MTSRESWVLGVSLIPVRARDKKPLVAWEPYQARRATMEERAAWVEKYPGCNWGMVTGPVSDVVAADFDGPAGAELLKKFGLESPQEGPPRVQTAHGVHLYYQWPKDPAIASRLKNAVRLLGNGKEGGLDLRAQGGYVLIPPSVHPSGAKYAYLRRPWEVEPPPLPSWLLDLLDRPATQAPPPKVLPGPTAPGLPPGAAEGERNAAAARVAGAYFRKGLAGAEVWAIMRAWNSQNTPPLPEDELKQTVWSIAKREAAQNTTIDVIGGDALLTMDTTPPPMLVEPMFPAGGKCVLAGVHGQGKSLLAVNLSVSVGNGMPLFGRFRTAKARVLYIDAENPPDLARRRLGKIAAGLQADPSAVSFVFPKRRMDLGDAKTRNTLCTSIQQGGYGLLVLDSFLCFASLRNENDNTEVRGYLETVGDITRATGAAVLVIDHATKPSNDRPGPPTPRGAGAKGDWADLVLSFDERKHETKFFRTLHFNKTRFCAPLGSALLEMDASLVFLATDEENLCSVLAVRQAVAEQPGISWGELVDLLMERTGGKERTVRYAIDRAKEMNEVRAHREGRSVRFYVGGLAAVQ